MLSAPIEMPSSIAITVSLPFLISTHCLCLLIEALIPKYTLIPQISTCLPFNLKGLIFKFTVWSKDVGSGPLWELEAVTRSSEPVFLICKIVFPPAPSSQGSRRNERDQVCESTTPIKGVTICP